MVGNPISTDGMTASRQKLADASILVEVDIEQELKEQVQIRDPNGEIIEQELMLKGLEDNYGNALGILALIFRNHGLFLAISTAFLVEEKMGGSDRHLVGMENFKSCVLTTRL
ncbi:hypothetical protein Ancab_029540 [Ancistrocladus abbreviatus]